MKHLLLFALLASFCHASEIVEKAVLLDEILSAASEHELIASFEDASMIGASLRAMRTHQQSPGNSAAFDARVAQVIKESVESSAIATFSVEELKLLKELAAGSATERHLALKVLGMSTSQNPQSMQKLSAVFMDFSQGALEQVRQTSREKTVRNNLRQIASAAQQYFLETGKDTVKLEDLVGPDKYIRRISPVGDESYPETIQQADSTVSAKFPDGEVHSLDL